MGLRYTLSFSLLMLFFYTATSKILNHEQFLYQLKISPFHLVNTSAIMISYTIPILEIALGLFLFVGIIKTQYLKISLTASILLMSIFEIYIVAMLLSGLDLPCSCGGIISKMSWQEHVIFNAIIIVTGVISLKEDSLYFITKRT